MIVYNTGYLKKEDVLALIENNVKFGIYETYKNTRVLVKTKYTLNKREYLYSPKNDRLPYKVIEGKKITYGTLIFDSTLDSVEKLDGGKWNNRNQIISYENYYNLHF